MLFLLRVIFGFALFAVFGRAIEVAGPSPQTEGTTDAGYLALAVILGIANAVVWAPWIGRWMADPLTGAFTTGHPADFTNRVVQFIHKLGARRWRRLALFFAFLEGIRHPDLPAAFVLGLNQARAGSWLERVFAREVWRFDHAENCLRAWKILRARGLDPGVHRRPEVNLLILSAQRERSPDPGRLPVPEAPTPPKPPRNPRIQLFDGANPPKSSDACPAGETPERTGATESAEVGPLPPTDPGAVTTSESGSPPREPTGPAEASPASSARLNLRERLRILITGRPPPD